MAGACAKKDAKEPAVKKAPAGGCGSCGQGAVKAEKPKAKVPAAPVKKQHEALKEKQPKVLKEKKPDRSV